MRLYNETGLNPTEFLRELEARVEATTVGLPLQREVKETWKGIGFRINDRSFVSPLEQVDEILLYNSQNLSPIPGAIEWVCGMANVRGSLLPIMDINGFFGYPLITRDMQKRVIVVKHNDLACGLLVDELYGMRHVEVTNLRSEVDTADVFAKYLDGVADIDRDDSWSVFSLYSLAEDSSFLQVASEK